MCSCVVLKRFGLVMPACLNTVQPVYNDPEAVTLYITVSGQLPQIFSYLPQQRVAVVHRFDYVTINKRFRYIS